MYDPAKPASLFEGDNLIEFFQGLHNAERLRRGIPGGDLSRPDVGVCMKLLSDADEMLEANCDASTAR